MLSKIQGLLKYCYNDSTCDKVPDMGLQLFLLSSKSLVPYEDKIGCMFDITRYEKEIELFKYYMNGHDDTLGYYFANKKPSGRKDELLECKIIPVAVSNTDWDVLLNEALKSVFFFSTNKDTILNAIIISSSVKEYLEDNDTDSMNEVTKERLIGFSLKDFLNNNNLSINKEGLIEFEKERVKMLLKYEPIIDDLKEKYKVLKYIYDESKSNEEMVDETVLSSFSLYLFKLRKGIISPEKLKISNNDVPEFREFLKHSSFVHPLLGRCVVLKRGEKEVILRNKSGLMKVNI